MGMLEETHEGYVFYQLFSEPSDFLFGGTARYRTWVVGAFEEATTCMHDPFEMHDLIVEGFKEMKPCTISDYLVGSRPEIFMEASELAHRRQIMYRPEWDGLEYLLLPREQQCLAMLNSKYQERTGMKPESDPDLVYFLGDSAWWSNSWSAVSGKIPTMRCNASTGIFWLPSQRRWLTAKEKLTSMGWPCTPEVADSMNVPLVGACDTKRASDLLGNSMHFTTAGIMQLIALSCFGPAQ